MAFQCTFRLSFMDTVTNSDGIPDEQLQNVLADREGNLLNILLKTIIEVTSATEMTEEEMKDSKISKEPNSIYKELPHGLMESIEQ